MVTDRYLSTLAIIAVVIVPALVVGLAIALANRGEQWTADYLIGLAALTLATLITVTALALALGHHYSRNGH